MKIIFLDIDGVLATSKSCSEGFIENMVALDGDSVSRLAALCTGGARIVISSSWRKLHTKEEVLAHLERFGLNRSTVHEDWRTVAIDHGIRGVEIAEWLDRHPEVEDFIILDDDDDFTPEQLPRHVQTTFDDGFSPEKAEHAVRLLQV